MTGKVIQFGACGDTKVPDRLYVLCDDGTMWAKQMAIGQLQPASPWVQLTPPPTKFYDEPDQLTLGDQES